MRQILSNEEEEALVQWIIRQEAKGYSISPKLVCEKADEIRFKRNSSANPLISRPIKLDWFTRFKTRHPEISSICTEEDSDMPLEVVSDGDINCWFGSVLELSLPNDYLPEHQYNMDEIAFAITEDMTFESRLKITDGKQGWITAIECVSAAGTALPPLLIFKSKYLKTTWIPEDTPRDWRISITHNGWTSNAVALEWLKTRFEPATRPNDPTQRRLLITSDHKSHTTSKFKNYCLEHDIDLLITPPCTSHLLQPLNVGVFGPLHCALHDEAEAAAASRLDSASIQSAEWVSMFMRARTKAMTASNVLNGWRDAGLLPFSPETVRQYLPSRIRPASSTRPASSGPCTLDLSVLSTVPSDSVEMRRFNHVFISDKEQSEPLSPVRNHWQGIAFSLEFSHSQMIARSKEQKFLFQYLNSRVSRTKGKKKGLKGKAVSKTKQVLKIA